MEYEDRVTIATPEGVDLDLRLAGIGSRFIAFLFDLAIKAAIVGAVAIVVFGGFGGLRTGSSGEALGGAVVIVAFFLVTFFYDVLFETLASGRTPGKRWTGLRVVRVGGQAVDLRTSAVRNLVRALEGLPTFYVPAMVSILVARRNQRLGDLAAGTLVVRERRATVAVEAPYQPAGVEEVASWDVSAVGAEELAAVRRFLDRRPALEAEARRRLGADLAERLRPRVAGAPADLDAEGFLERLVAAKAARTS